MPRVHHVKKARKDNPVCKAGESYYWWKFRYGGKRYSLTRPRPSQLTNSPYFGSIRSLVEKIEDTTVTDADQLNELKEEVRDELESIQSECQDSLDNMPDSLQYSPTGELLQERIDACDSAISDFDSIEDEFDFEENAFEDEYDDDDFEDDKEREEKRDEHEKDEDSRREQELIEWCEGAVSEMIDFVGNCEV
jgi:hypothetical protein